MPPSDGEKLRAEFRAERAAVNGSRATYDRARDAIRDVLRQEPFDAATMREAMSKTRAARQDFDQTLQAVIAKAAAEMSAAGRRQLADWPSRSRANQR